MCSVLAGSRSRDSPIGKGNLWNRVFEKQRRPLAADLSESWVETNMPAVRWREKRASRQLLRGALHRDDREMSPLGVEANRQIELGSGLTADKSLRFCAARPTGPSRAWLETRR